MPGPAESGKGVDEKALRRAEHAAIGLYHQEQLRILLEHVRAGFAQLDAGDIDEFELDHLIHHYKRSVTELWKFCEGPRSAPHAASTLAYRRAQGEEPDWWEAGTPWRER